MQVQTYNSTTPRTRVEAEVFTTTATDPNVASCHTHQLLAPLCLFTGYDTFKHRVGLVSATSSKLGLPAVPLLTEYSEMSKCDTYKHMKFKRHIVIGQLRFRWGEYLSTNYGPTLSCSVMVKVIIGMAMGLRVRVRCGPTLLNLQCYGQGCNRNRATDAV